MSDKRFAIGITIGAALAGGFSRTVGGAKRDIDAMGGAIDQLERKRREIKKFDIDTRSVQKIGQDLTNARQKLKDVQQALKKNPGDSGLRKETVAAGQAVGKLSALLTQQRRQLGETRSALRSAGIDTSNLRVANEKLAASIKKVERADERRARVGRIGQGIVTAGAGVVAAGAVVARPLSATMGYEYQMAGLANTAYAGESFEARRTGMEDLKKGIIEAIREGGGTREIAAETLDSLVASGAFGDGREGIERSLKLLPSLQKFGTASGASSTELGQIAIAATRFNIKDDQLSEALDMAIRAGQLGGFELRDMAKWLPQQMAAARQSGLIGMEGFSKLLSVNQASRTTAGTVDEAGNNLVNLLAKINSADTTKDVKKATGLDLPRYLAAERAKGIDSITAFVGIIDKLAAKDKQFNALRKQAATAPEGEKRATIEQMANILQGSAVGQIVQDRQALMSLLAVMNNREYIKNIEKEIGGGAAIGTGVANFELMKSTAQYNAEALNNEKVIAQDSAFTKLMPGLTAVAAGMTDIAREYPVLTTATVAASTALTALAAAAGAGTLVSLLTNRAAGKAGTTKGVMSALSGASGVVGKVAGKAALPVAIAANVWEAGQVMLDSKKSGADKKVALTGLVGGAGGAWGGMAAGAALGSVIPGVGTLIGGIVGSILGSIGGKKLGEVTGEAVFKRADTGKLPDNVSKATPAPVEKKAVLQATYNIAMQGVGMRDVEQMIAQRLTVLHRDQETRMRASMLDGMN